MRRTKDVGPKAPSPKRSDSKEIVEAILVAAREFALEGADKISMNKVAQRAGVGVASVYRYFPDTKALCTELFRRHHQETAAKALVQIRAATSLKEMAFLCVQDFLGVDAQQMALRRTLNFDVPIVWTLEELQASTALIYQSVVDALIPLVPGVSKEVLGRRVFYALSIMRGAVLMRLQLPSEEPPTDELVAELAQIVQDIVEGTHRAVGPE